MSDAESRRSPRVARSLMARYRSAAVGQTSWLMSPLRDMSTSGARFLAERTYPVGTRLEMELLLPMLQQPLTITAQVVRATPATGVLCEHAVIFDMTDPHTKQTLEDAVAHFLRKRAEQS